MKEYKLLLVTTTFICLLCGCKKSDNALNMKTIYCSEVVNEDGYMCGKYIFDFKETDLFDIGTSKLSLIDLAKKFFLPIVRKLKEPGSSINNGQKKLIKIGMENISDIVKNKINSEKDLRYDEVILELSKIIWGKMKGVSTAQHIIYPLHFSDENEDIIKFIKFMIMNPNSNTWEDVLVYNQVHNKIKKNDLPSQNSTSENNKELFEKNKINEIYGNQISSKHKLSTLWNFETFDNGDQISAEHKLSTLWNFETFDNGVKKDALYFLKNLMQMIENHNNCNQFVYIYGSPSTGKTHLISGFINCLKEKGIPVFYKNKFASEEVMKGRYEMEEIPKNVAAIVVDDFVFPDNSWVKKFTALENLRSEYFYVNEGLPRFINYCKICKERNIPIIISSNQTIRFSEIIEEIYRSIKLAEKFIYEENTQMEEEKHKKPWIPLYHYNNINIAKLEEIKSDLTSLSNYFEYIKADAKTFEFVKNPEELRTGLSTSSIDLKDIFENSNKNSIPGVLFLRKDNFKESMSKIPILSKMFDSRLICEYCWLRGYKILIIDDSSCGSLSPTSSHVANCVRFCFEKGVILVVNIKDKSNHDLFKENVIKNLKKMQDKVGVTGDISRFQAMWRVE